MKTKLFFLLLVAFLYFGCGDDDSSAPVSEIKSSLFITVNDPQGKPVQGAAIGIGELSGVTGDDGTFFFTSITLTGNDYLQVEKGGYFKGSRRFQAAAEQTQFVNITLLPQVEIGVFNNAQSAVLAIDQKSKLTFPDHAITRANGSPYNGNVHVLASPIYGDDPQLSQKMPGDLTGLDVSGERVALSSLGMLGVELQADNGEILQIASGKTVEMQFGISNLQVNTAPSTIPLWYFDEDKGYWVEEGEAVKQGNVYVAQLPHFSFWNCDEPNTMVNWEARFVYEDGRPVQNSMLCLTNLSLNDQRCEMTDANGTIKGGIPSNEVLRLTLQTVCGSVGYADNVGPYSSDVNIGTLEIESLDHASISGTALQCNGSPLKSGFVKLSTPRSIYVLPIKDAEGHFSGNYDFCDGDVLTLRVFDTENDLLSLSHFFSFNRNLDAGSIKACDETDEFVRYKITGFSREYMYYNVKTSNSQITRIETVDSIGFRGRLGWTFDGVTAGQYKGYTMSGNQINLPNGQVGYVLTMDVNVTEYGPVGGYISGSFSGKINKGGNGSGGSGHSDFSGTFSVKRE